MQDVFNRDDLSGEDIARRPESNRFGLPSLRVDRINGAPRITLKVARKFIESDPPVIAELMRPLAWPYRLTDLMS